jgi:hypothetical protein
MNLSGGLFRLYACSSTRWNACWLNPAHLPGHQNADEEDNREPDPKGKGGGHIAFRAGLTFLRRGTAPHHVKQSRAQAQHNANEGDDNQYFHEHIIQ